jgi:dynein light chain 1
MSHNYVREWREFEHLSELPVLEDLVFIGNPIEEDAASAGKYTEDVTRRLMYLKKLDGFPVIRGSDANDDEEVSSTLDIDEIDRMAKYIHLSLGSVFAIF